METRTISILFKQSPLDVKGEILSLLGSHILELKEKTYEDLNQERIVVTVSASEKDIVKKLRQYFKRRDDVIAINDEEKPSRNSISIAIDYGELETVKQVLKLYLRALKYYYYPYPSTIKNYYWIPQKNDWYSYDYNKYVGEFWVYVKYKKKMAVMISEYIVYRKDKRFVLSLSCLPKSKQREFVKKVKQLLKDKTKIQVL